MNSKNPLTPSFRPGEGKPAPAAEPTLPSHVVVEPSSGGSGLRNTSASALIRVSTASISSAVAVLPRIRPAMA
jgi:hypothetical protein